MTAASLTPDEMRKFLERALRAVVRSGRDAKRVKFHSGRVAWVLRLMHYDQVLIDYFEGKFDRDPHRPKGTFNDDGQVFLKDLMAPRLEQNKGKPHYRAKTAQQCIEFLQTEEGRERILCSFALGRTFTEDEVRKAAGCRFPYNK
jgi:hypothetical protein